MTLMLDHLAVSAESRDAARAHVEQSLGLPMQTGGEHARFGTHNHLMGMENGLYLEAISIDPDAAAPGRPRWFDLDNFSGPARLTNWICSVDDIAKAVSAWPEAGDPISLTRGDLQWQMAVPPTGVLPFDGAFPALIEWAGTLHPNAMLTATPAELVMLTVLCPQAQVLQSTLGQIKGTLVRFEQAEQTRFVAEIQTPHGRRILQ